MIKKTVFLIIAITFLNACHQDDRTYKGISHKTMEAYFNPLSDNYNTKNGHFYKEEKHKTIWKKVSFDSIKLPPKFNISSWDLQESIALLNTSNKELYSIIGDDLEVSKHDLIYTANIIKMYTFFAPIDISRYLDIYELSGKQKDGNILYTGYYTPELSFKSKPDLDYNIPLVVGKKRNTTLDTLCYVSNIKELQNIKMQGSAILVIDDKYKKHVSFLRENKIETKDTIYKELVFKKRHSITPYGALGIPLTAGHTIAVDHKFIPLGSTILGIVPKRSNKKILHESRILLAQDTGGNINGAGHIDLFLGSGITAHKKAISLHHFGKIYLLLPKKKTK